jgi:hypothetical protein
VIEKMLVDQYIANSNLTKYVTQIGQQLQYFSPDPSTAPGTWGIMGQWYAPVHFKGGQQPEANESATVTARIT